MSYTDLERAILCLLDPASPQQLKESASNFCDSFIQNSSSQPSESSNKPAAGSANNGNVVSNGTSASSAAGNSNRYFWLTCFELLVFSQRQEVKFWALQTLVDYVRKSSVLIFFFSPSLPLSIQKRKEKLNGIFFFFPLVAFQYFFFFLLQQFLVYNSFPRLKGNNLSKQYLNGLWKFVRTIN